MLLYFNTVPHMASSSRRNKGVLFNPTWEQMVERDPLIAFSWYLCGRTSVLLYISDEIVENLDRGFTTEVIHGELIDRAESLMWLWILGAYEVVRTMCQAKSCFSDRAYKELVLLKRKLARVRMPAAKMEKAGQNRPVTSNRSPTGWDVKARDLLVNDPEVTPDISARYLLIEFERVIESITPDDILARHEDSYDNT